ncbi:MAG: hypothetical protein Q9225_002358 [Loekoesia sp. 1 TL-2023]
MTGVITMFSTLNVASRISEPVRRQHTDHAGDLGKLSDVQFVNVVDLVQRSENHQETSVLLAKVDLEIHIFQLHDQPGADLDDETDMQGQGLDLDENTQEIEQLHAHVTFLPHVDLDGLWELLANIDVVSIAKRPPGSKANLFNRLVLLYGPPGTGKSTLCRALAQKLAIRLKGQYERTTLIELDTATLFSKFFGQSSRLVSKMFDKIENMLDQEPNVFLCLVVDEIESLASTRQHATGANEPKDSLRAVNALFIALDRLGRYPNVIVFCTSNLVQAIDSAFLDRIDVKQYIQEPSTRIRYEIFRRCYFDLIECSIVALMQANPPNEGALPDGPAEDISLVNGRIITHAEDYIYEALPTYDVMQLNFRANHDSVPYRLWKIAERSAVGGLR